MAAGQALGRRQRRVERRQRRLGRRRYVVVAVRPQTLHPKTTKKNKQKATKMHPVKLDDNLLNSKNERDLRR